eukprot:7291214-Pyramimonas_sp.AAC.1
MWLRETPLRWTSPEPTEVAIVRSSQPPREQRGPQASACNSTSLDFPRARESDDSYAVHSHPGSTA